MYSNTSGAGEGLVPTLATAVSSIPAPTSPPLSSSLASGGSPPAIPSPPIPATTSTTTTTAVGPPPTQPEPTLVAAVQLVASSLHDTGCGVAVTRLKQQNLQTLLTKQNLLNKIKKIRKFKGSEAVEWMRANFGISREEAQWIGQTLFEWEYILSKSQTEFLDGGFNYFFQELDGAFTASASSTPKKVGQAVAHLLSFYTQVEGDQRRPKGSFLMGLTPEAREEYEARQLERLAAAQAQADISMRDRKDSATGEGSGWLGRNMRKMRAKRDRLTDGDRTIDSYDFPSLSTSPSGTERLDSSEGLGSGIRLRGLASGDLGGVSASGSGGYGIESERGGPAVWASVAEEDTAEIRYMAANSDGVPRIKAATADKLVEWLTSHKYSDAKFRDAFMLTYRSFMTPQELLRKLLHRYMGKFTPDPHLTEEELEQQLNLVRIKVVMVLKHWMKEHGYDFRKEGRDSGNVGDIMYELESFITDILPLYMKPAAEQLRRTFDTWEAEHQAKKASQAALPPSVSIRNVKELSIDDIDATVLAQQMCLLEHELWRMIRPSECLNKAWSNHKQKHLTSPNILAIIKRFNMTSAWVTSQVVNKVKLTDRVNTIKKFIFLGKKLAECNNFNGVMQVMSGLHSSPVARLKKSWEMINKEDEWASTMKFLEDLTSHDSSYKLYRQALHGSVPPCVPYLGVYLTDLTFIEDGNPNTVEDLINWNKNQMIAAVITEIRFYQTPSYTYPLVPEIRDMLQEMPQVEDEAVAYTLSLKVEPRDTTEAIETLLMEEAKLKLQVQQLQVRIADLEMENRRLNEQNAHLMDVVKDIHRKNSRREVGGEQAEPEPQKKAPPNRAIRKSKEAMFFEKVKRASAPSSNPFDPAAAEHERHQREERKTVGTPAAAASGPSPMPVANGQGTPLSPRANGMQRTAAVKFGSDIVTPGTRAGGISSAWQPNPAAAASGPSVALSEQASQAAQPQSQQQQTINTPPVSRQSGKTPPPGPAGRPLVRVPSNAGLKPNSPLPSPPMAGTPGAAPTPAADKGRYAFTSDLSLASSPSGPSASPASASPVSSSPVTTPARALTSPVPLLRPSFAQTGVVVRPIPIPTPIPKPLSPRSASQQAGSTSSTSSQAGTTSPTGAADEPPTSPGSRSGGSVSRRSRILPGRPRPSAPPPAPPAAGAALSPVPPSPPIPAAGGGSGIFASPLKPPPGNASGGPPPVPPLPSPSTAGGSTAPGRPLRPTTPGRLID